MNIREREFLRFLTRFDEHPFTVKIGGKRYKIGEGRPEFGVVFHRIPELSKLLKSTSIALGEAYMDGSLEIEGDLYHALNRFMGQIGKFSTDRRALKKLLFSSQDKKNQLKEVSSHYDIGNDFYRLWLDETMSYSCSFFQHKEDSLYKAQCNKIDRILRKLQLAPGMSLCDIGCGWGYLLMEAVKKYDVNGVGITLSREQKAGFEEEIRKAGLGGRIQVKLMDYRDISGLNMQFDRVVSVGMLEHVGRENYPLFLKNVKRVLKPGGIFLLHFISALKEYPGDPWIKKYIFPGGMIPSLREIIHEASELRFYTIDVESLRRHYTRTLLHWNKNFQNHRELVELRFDKKFVRMWELYLCVCAAAFMNGIVDLHQVVFTNDVNNKIRNINKYCK